MGTGLITYSVPIDLMVQSKKHGSVVVGGYGLTPAAPG